MVSQGRGQLGLAFLVAALIMMPILVFAYDPPPAADVASVGVLPTSSGSVAPTTPPPDGPATSSPDGPAAPSPDGPAILGIDGLGDGRPLHGAAQIYAYVHGDVGGILFRIEGPRAGFSYVADEYPYLLDPHDPPRGGWDTAFVPDGEYTLTATSIVDPDLWKSAQFIVRNG